MNVWNTIARLYKIMGILWGMKEIYLISGKRSILRGGGDDIKNYGGTWPHARLEHFRGR